MRVVKIKEQNLENMVNEMTEDEKELYKTIKQSGLSKEELKYYLKQLKRAKIDGRTYTLGKSNVKFGIISDTHIGSKYYDSDMMTYASRVFKKEQIDFVVHAGDIIDGMYPNRGGQIYELDEIGIDNQINRAIKELRKIKQPLYFITGNHDFTAKRIAGVIVGNRVEDKVKNAKFLGEDYGRLILKSGVTIDLVHPYDGTSYAISYKTQKRADALEGGRKPNIMIVGNYHKSEYLFYRNIHIFQPGTFQSQTPFMRGKGISVHKGFWILELTSKGKTITSLKQTFYPIYD